MKNALYEARMAEALRESQEDFAQGRFIHREPTSLPQSSGNARSMTKLLYSNRFASDLAGVTSANIERKIFDILDTIEAADDIGSKAVPESIRSEFGAGVRKLAVNPFDLVYTCDTERDIVFIEAPIHQRTAW